MYDIYSAALQNSHELRGGSDAARLASLFLLLLLLVLLFESFHLLVKVKLYNSKSVTRLTRAAIQRHLTLTYLVGVVAIHS